MRFESNVEDSALDTEVMDLDAVTGVTVEDDSAVGVGIAELLKTDKA